MILVVSESWFCSSSRKKELRSKQGHLKQEEAHGGDSWRVHWYFGDEREKRLKSVIGD